MDGDPKHPWKIMKSDLRMQEMQWRQEGQDSPRLEYVTRDSVDFAVN